LTKCGGQCVDQSTDPLNCGGCGIVCPTVVGPNLFVGGCCNNGTCITLPSLSSAQPNPGACNTSTNTNYWLAAPNCANISGLSVTIDPQPVLTADSFSLQLNAVPPPNNRNQFQWMQYFFEVSSHRFDWPPRFTTDVNGWVEYWSQPPAGALCASFANNYVGSQCCSGGNCCTSTDIFGNDTCNTLIRGGGFSRHPIPAGSDIASYQISLSTDITGNVTQANFVVIGKSGDQTSLAVPIPTNVQAPIQAFQFVAGGLDNCAIANFDSGSGASIIYDSPSGQQLCVQGPSNLCSGNSRVTGESSDASYGLMNTCCGTQLQQTVSA